MIHDNPFSGNLKWDWGVDEHGYPDCGIFFEKHPGYAYAVARCPKYVDKDMWTAYATALCKAWNERSLTLGNEFITKTDLVDIKGITFPEEIALVYYDGYHAGLVQDFPDDVRYKIIKENEK